ncbi:MAG TPA: cytochrome C oxidase subunit IV family protein [Acidimicrobiia bacterium]|jgi:cytochrome c oxidase subunit IV|nr:cytochrome C oxidase subunit IV family protein [Acidimicrobiia bacterium]
MSTSEHIHHPTPAQYWKIAVVLAVLTAIEVAIYYIHRDFDLGNLNTPLLIILAALKFVIVVGWYMHLRFEKPTLRRFFTAGIILAAALYTIILTALGAIILQD